MRGSRWMASQRKHGRPPGPPIRAAASLVMLAALATALPAAAGDKDSALADALFQAAKELASQQNYADACPKFEASYHLDPTLGTLLNLADCNEKLGKIASAWARWGEAVDKATRAGDNRVDFAKGRRDALTGRLPKLTIQVKNPLPRLEVHIDDVKLEQAGFGVPLPVDPGKHVIAVVRGTERLKEQHVELAEKAAEDIELDLAAIEKAAPPPASDKPLPTAPPAPTSPPPPAKSTQKTVGLVVGGVGIGLAAVAGALELAALGKKGEANTPGTCQEKVCAPGGLKIVQEARTLADGGQWLGVGSLIVIAVGATIFLTAPAGDHRTSPSSRTTPPPRRNAWIAPWATPNSGGILLGGKL